MTDIAYTAQKFVVASSNRTARLRPSLQMRQLDVQNRALQAVHPAVDAFHHMLALAAVTSERRHPIGQSLVIGHGAAGIAVSSQVLSRIERKGGHVPESSHDLSLVARQCAWAQSSITQSLCFRAIAMIASMSAG